MPRKLTKKKIISSKLPTRQVVKKTNILSGPGLATLRADQVILKNAGERLQPPLWGIPASLKHRISSLENGNKIYEPALIGVPVHLRAVTKPEPLPAAEIKKPSATVLEETQGNRKNATATRKVESKGGAVAASSSSSSESVEDKDFKLAVEAAAEALVERTVPGADILDMNGRPISNTDIFNFYSYVYLKKPVLEDIPGVAPGSPYLSQFLMLVKQALKYAVYNWVKRNLTLYDDTVVADDYHATDPWRISHITITTAQLEALYMVLFSLFIRFSAAGCYELYMRASDLFRVGVIDALNEWLRLLFHRTNWDDIAPLEHSSASPAVWQNTAAEIEALFRSMFPDAELLTVIPEVEGFSFSPYPLDEVFFGLQLAYCQEWTKLGNQKGQTVKLLPLGPKQSEKISIKRVTTTKLNRTVDTLQAKETTRESATTEKDSSDVVKEAASSLNWHVDTEAKVNVGMFSGSVSAGVGGDNSQSSRDAKSSINESVEKTASKTRNETKIIISTEQSQTEEYTSASEISNPNDEIAITYVYSRLLRKYEIYTYLSEISSVVFVPEPLPEVIGLEWVRHYDWILAKVLLDESFREDFSNIVNDVDPVEPEAGSVDDMETFRKMATNAGASIGEFKGIAGSLPDIFKGAADVFANQLDKKNAVNEKYQRRQQRNKRLFRHIRENILHYMRAIWSQEDPQQRIKRYERIMVPTEWIFVPESGVAVNGETSAWPGQFIPVPESTQPLSDIINPAGPIGYAANCAVFYLKGNPATVNCNQALTALRAQYVRYTVQNTVLNGERLIDTVVMEPHWHQAKYTINFVAGAVAIRNQTPYVTYPLDSAAILTEQSGRALLFEGVYVYFDQAPNNAQYEIMIQSTGQLEDPEVRMMRKNYPLPDTNNESAYFDPILTDMKTELYELGDLSGTAWNTLTSIEQDLVREHYHQYLMKKEYTRRILLDTNDVMLDLNIGETPMLEEFKRLHRAVDVAKVLEEYDQVRIDNIRRKHRIEANDYADPHVDKVTVIGSKKSLSSLVGTLAEDEGNE